MLAARHWCPAPVCRGVLLRWAAAAAKSRQRPVSTLVPLPALRVVRRRPAALLAPRAVAASSRVPRAPPGAPVEASSPCSRPSTVGARGRVLSRIFEMTCASCGSPAASRDPLLAGPGAGGVDGASSCRRLPSTAPCAVPPSLPLSSPRVDCHPHPLLHMLGLGVAGRCFLPLAQFVGTLLPA